jgi:DNA-binding beta-propeller fold protein YncE
MSRSPAGRWPTMVLSLAVDPGTHTVYVTNLGLGFNSVSVIESR